MKIALIKELNRFVQEEVCPVNEQCVAGFVSGAHSGWGWARNRVREILEKNPIATPSIPDHAVCFFKDGDQWCCVGGDFINLQESPAGFGDTFDQALDHLQSQMISKTGDPRAVSPASAQG